MQEAKGPYNLIDTRDNEVDSTVTVVLCCMARTSQRRGKEVKKNGRSALSQSTAVYVLYGTALTGPGTVSKLHRSYSTYSTAARYNNIMMSRPPHCSSLLRSRSTPSQKQCRLESHEDANTL